MNVRVKNGAAEATVWLPIARWKESTNPIDIELDASAATALQEAGVVGKVVIKGDAKVGGREIIVQMHVELSTREICSRTLEEFDNSFTFELPLLIRRDARVGAEPVWEPESEETFLVAVHDDCRELDIGEILRQAVELDRPLSPVKPGAPLPPGVIGDDVEQEKPIDPRWEALRQLKKPT